MIDDIVSSIQLADPEASLKPRIEVDIIVFGPAGERGTRERAQHITRTLCARFGGSTTEEPLTETLGRFKWSGTDAVTVTCFYERKPAALVEEAIERALTDDEGLPILTDCLKEIVAKRLMMQMAKAGLIAWEGVENPYLPPEYGSRLTTERGAKRMNNWMSATSYAAFICMCASFIYLVFSLIRIWRQFRPVSEDDPALAEALRAVMQDETLRDLVLAILNYREAFNSSELGPLPVVPPRDGPMYRPTPTELDLAYRFRKALMVRAIPGRLAKALLEVD